MPTRRAFIAGALALAARGAWAAGSTWDRLRRGGLVVFVACADASAWGPIAKRLRDERVPVDRVLASPDCRDAARLAFGQAEIWEPLGLPPSPSREAEQGEHVRKRIAGYTQRKPRGNVVMITHAPIIVSLTKRSVGPGEAIVVRPDGCCGLRTVGRLELP